MTNFNLIASSIIISLTILCFWLPYKGGKKITGILTSFILGMLLLWTFLARLEFLVIFIWPTIIAFQLIFLSYWIFNLFNRKKTGIVISSTLAFIFVLIALSPWINDWIFNKNEVKKMLSWHKIELKDDFIIIENESGGLMDYAHSFTLKISESDFENISSSIRNSIKNKEILTKLKRINGTRYNYKDTINYENELYLEREYYTKEIKEDGTFHFVIQLSKKKKELNYYGANE